MDLIAFNGATKFVFRTWLLNADGAGVTGVVRTDTDLYISTILDNESTAVTCRGNSTIADITTLGTWADPTNYNVRFKEVDSTNHPGLYEIHLPNNRLTNKTSGSFSIAKSGTVSGGTYTITINGTATAAIAYDADAATVQTAVDAAIGATKVVVAGGALPNTAMTVKVHPGGTLKDTIITCTVDSASLTGGGSYAVTNTSVYVPPAKTLYITIRHATPDFVQRNIIVQLSGHGLASDAQAAEAASAAQAALKQANVARAEAERIDRKLDDVLTIVHDNLARRGFY